MEWATPDCLKPTPHMGPAHWERILLEAASSSVLEFGSGGSTWYIQRNHYPVLEWLAVEHNAEWYREVFAKIRGNTTSVSVMLATSLEHYAYPPVESRCWDVVIVDGKYRDAVLAGVHEYLAEDGVVFLHDAERRYTIPPTLRLEEQYPDPSWEQNPKAELAVLVRA